MFGLSSVLLTHILTILNLGGTAMPELTPDIVRDIVKEEIGSAHDKLRQELTEEFADGIEQVLNTMQSFHEEDQDYQAGFDGRLRAHGQRLGQLERHTGLEKRFQNPIALPKQNPQF
jgi:hypothetical protein